MDGIARAVFGPQLKLPLAPYCAAGPLAGMSVVARDAITVAPANNHDVAIWGTLYERGAWTELSELTIHVPALELCMTRISADIFVVTDAPALEVAGAGGSGPGAGRRAVPIPDGPALTLISLPKDLFITRTGYETMDETADRNTKEDLDAVFDVLDRHWTRPWVEP